MHSFNANLYNEVQKMVSRKKNVIFMGIIAILPLLGAIFIAAIQNKIGIAPISGSEFPVLVLDQMVGLLLPFLIFMLAAEIFSDEFADQTIKNVLVRPITRWKIFMSKLCCIFLYIIMTLAAVFIVSSLSSVLLADHGNYFLGLFKGVLAYSLAFVPLAAISILATAAAQLYQKGSTTLLTLIFLYFGSSILSAFFARVAKLNLFKYVHWHRLWLSVNFDAIRVLNIFLFILSCSILLLTAGYFLFQRKEI